MFHLKVSLRFEDGIVETNSAIYECNYVLIVGRYVVFFGECLKLPNKVSLHETGEHQEKLGK